jgi:hypothetical protein
MEIRKPYFSSNAVRVIKLRRMKRVEHGSRARILRSVCNILVGEAEGNKRDQSGDE